jgi:hypothetical protein
MGTVEYINSLQTKNPASVFFDSFVEYCDKAENEGFAPWDGYFTLPLCGCSYDYHLQMVKREENDNRPVLYHNIGIREIHTEKGYFNDIDGILGAIYSKSIPLLSGKFDTFRKINANLCGRQDLLCASHRYGVEIDFHLTDDGNFFYLERGKKFTDTTPLLFPLFFLRHPSVAVFGCKRTFEAGTRFNIAVLIEGRRAYLDEGLLEELKQSIIRHKGLHM